MSAIATLALIILAWFFTQSGATFLGFLCIMLAVILMLAMAFAPKAPAPAYAAGAPGAMVIAPPGAAIPPKVEFRFQPDWKGPQSGEERFGERIGNMANFVAYTIKGIAGLFKAPQEK